MRRVELDGQATLGGERLRIVNGRCFERKRAWLLGRRASAAYDVAAEVPQVVQDKAAAA
jgi:hypothetical protein